VRLVFLHGPAASGKLTVAKELAALTGLSLFHNHLVVDALLAVFPFGSPGFVELRERMWLDVFAAAAAENRSLIFTFHPEAPARRACGKLSSLALLRELEAAGAFAYPPLPAPAVTIDTGTVAPGDAAAQIRAALHL